MFFTLNELIEGNNEITTWYQNALSLWEEILKPFDLKNPSQFSPISKILLEKQGKFEHECGGRTIGKEIMAISAIIQYYKINTGFEDEWDQPNAFRKIKAKTIYNAIQFSGCSLEVKSNAKRIAKTYGLIEG